jgi:hypothetical protein
MGQLADRADGLLSSLIVVAVAVAASNGQAVQQRQVHHRGAWRNRLMTYQVTHGARPNIAARSPRGRRLHCR